MLLALLAVANSYHLKCAWSNTSVFKLKSLQVNWEQTGPLSPAEVRLTHRTNGVEVIYSSSVEE